MRLTSIACLSALLSLFAATASAGNVTLSGGQSSWQSTRCTEPAAPASLLAMDRESRASDVNISMQSYNAYAAKMQDYMNCLSNEAQADSDLAGKTILQSAQNAIEAAKRKVDTLHDPLKTKE